MKSRNTIVRITVLLLLSAVLCTVFSGCGKQDANEITSFAQLSRKGTKIGVAFNMYEYETLKKDYPDATIIAYHDHPLGYEDVANGRIDAYVYARQEMELAVESGTKGVKVLEDNYRVNPVACAVSPKTTIPSLLEKLNEFIGILKTDGTMDNMFRHWVTDLDDRMPEIPKAKDPKYRLRVGTAGTVRPYSYYVGTELRGYDIEFAYRFASWLGAEVEFRIYDFDGIIAAAAAGDVDCIMSNLYKTAENEKVIPFTDTLLNVEITAMVRDKDAKSGSKTASLTMDDLKNADIGTITGANFAEHIMRALPQANILYFNTVADEINAVKAGKVAACALDQPVARNVMAQDGSVKMMDGTLEELNYGLIFGKTDKGKELCEEFSAYVQALKSDGRLKEMQKKWFDAPDLSAVVMTDYRGLPDTNGTLYLATFQNPPFSFSKEELSVGYEVDMFVSFCKERGYGLEVTDVTLDALLSTVQSGRFDAACGGIAITEERKENMYFSEPNYSGGTVLLVKAGNGEDNDKKIFSSLAASFERTFIREDRWKLFLSGIGTTVLITVCSVFFGTLLGFFVFMLCRKGNRFANAVTRFAVWLVSGMPVVVLLMILYYIIFGQVAISGTVVSIFGFTLIFGSAVFSMVKAGVSAVDYGQTEAAYALGYTDRKTFFRIVFPQALPHFLPAYRAEIVSLIKATAVVGYVAVQDLTKMGDIVRSRTYEAFFPLIAVAVIYFVLAAILTSVVNLIVGRIDPKRRSKNEILKGVERK